MINILKVLNARLHKNSVSWLRKCGAEIGENVFLYDRFQCSDADATCLKIGNNVKLVGTKILTHDASPQLFLKKDCVRLGRVEIGDNVFVGLNSIILPNVRIGNNVIIGAGSIVTRDIPDNSVAVGNPARVIESIEQYIDKTNRLISDEENVVYGLNRRKLTEHERVTLNRRLEERSLYCIEE